MGVAWGSKLTVWQMTVSLKCKVYLCFNSDGYSFSHKAKSEPFIDILLITGIKSKRLTDFKAKRENFRSNSITVRDWSKSIGGGGGGPGRSIWKCG